MTMTSTLLCLAATIFFEARGETTDGMYAVADVVMNRVAHEKFPDTVCRVVYFPRAFSYTHDGLSDHMEDYPQPDDVEARIEAFIIAKDVLEGNTLVGTTATHYHTTSVAPFWSVHKDFAIDGQIGVHIFYTCSGYC